MALTPKQQRFVAEYLIDLNATQAAIRSGYSANRADAMGHENLRKPEIAAAVKEQQLARQSRTEIDQDRIVRELVNILEADPNELVEHRLTCCRFCHGKGFKFQRTANEMERDREQHRALIEANDELPKAKRRDIPPFDVKGGIGYRAPADPNPQCPECFGEGVSKVLVKDTRKLSPAARSLFAGIKQTKDGMQVLTHSKEGFITLLMRHQGMFTDKVEHSGSIATKLSDTELDAKIAEKMALLNGRAK